MCLLNYDTSSTLTFSAIFCRHFFASVNIIPNFEYTKIPFIKRWSHKLTNDKKNPIDSPNKKEVSKICQIINSNIVKTKGRPRGRAKSSIEKNLKKNINHQVKKMMN